MLAVGLASLSSDVFKYSESLLSAQVSITFFYNYQIKIYLGCCYNLEKLH
jgi:hypothetical protein